VVACVGVRVTAPCGTRPPFGSAYGLGVGPRAVTGVPPNSGPLAGGNTVTVSGSGFLSATQVAFARNFGEVQVHVLSQYHGYKEHPEIYMLSNLDKDGNPSGKHPDRGTLYWHTDGSWKECTGQATMMYSEIVPDAGGETEFADMYSAYDLLPAAMKPRFEGRLAIHNFDFSLTRRPGEAPLTAEQKAKVPPVAHPVVRTHPETGRKCLYVNSGFTTRIEGLGEKESRALLDMLFDHVRTPEFQCRFRWQRNSVAFWDNRAAQHYALWDYFPHSRLGYRVTICGTRPA